MTGFFLVHCCLQSQGQHCTEFQPVQGCPRSIKTSLKKVFSCPISKYIWGNIAQEHYLYNVNPKRTDIVLQENNLRKCLKSPWTNTVQGNYLCNVDRQSTVQSMLSKYVWHNFERDKLLVQCLPRPHSHLSTGS